MKTLAYIGKAYPHNDALMQLREQGYALGLLHDISLAPPKTERFDWVIGLDFSSENAFKHAFQERCSDIILDGILCPYENYIIFKAIAADMRGLPSLSINAARQSTDKQLMRQKFLEYDVSITPEYSRVDSVDDLLIFARTHQFPLILKPANLVKSLLISKCDSLDDLLRAYKDTSKILEQTYHEQHVVDREPSLIVEEFMQGTLCSVAAFVDRNGEPHFCPGVTDLVSAQDIGYNDNFLYSRKLPASIAPVTQEQLFRVAEKGVRALALTSSPAHIEIIYDQHRARIVEIGARIGGYRPRMYQLSYDLDMISQEALLATGQMPTLKATFRQYSAMYELFPRQNSQFTSLHPSSQSVNTYTYFHQIAQTGDKIGKSKDGYRAAAIIGTADPDESTFKTKCLEIENVELLTL